MAAIDEPVYKVRRIVPVRFIRARSGTPHREFPDLDERGWLHDPPGTRGETPAEVHGPVLGMEQTREVTVKCERLRLAPTADGGPELFIRSQDTSVVEVIEPAGGGPLPADGVFKLKGGSGSWRDKFARVTAHLRSPEGTLIGEMGVRVFQRRILRVQPWLISIRGRTAPGAPLTTGAPATTAARITTLFRFVNHVWRQCGLHFSVDAARAATVTLTFPGQICHNGDGAASHPAPDGTMIGPNRDDSDPVHQANRTANRLNIWWIQGFRDVDPAAAGQVMAWALDNTADSPGNLFSGVVMSDGADGNDLAHEIGHWLTLDHADEPAAGSANRDLNDVTVLRRLMFRFNPHGAGGFRSNVGYGAGMRGALLTMRDKAKYFRDDEWFETRRHAFRGPY